MTCNDCVHSEVCYLKKDGISEDYADKCGYSLFDNEERPQGEWIDHGYSFYICNNCGMGNNNAGGCKTNFCPNCGADMRGNNNDRKRGDRDN